jgi:hypothetical protein
MESRKIPADEAGDSKCKHLKSKSILKRKNCCGKHRHGEFSHGESTVNVRIMW